jgi:hypothetical protein
VLVGGGQRHAACAAKFLAMFVGFATGRTGEVERDAAGGAEFRVSRFSWAQAMQRIVVASTAVTGSEALWP